MIPSRLSLSLSIAYAFDVLLFTGVPFSAGFLFDTFVFLRCGSVLNQKFEIKLDVAFTITKFSDLIFQKRSHVNSVNDFQVS